MDYEKAAITYGFPDPDLVTEQKPEIPVDRLIFCTGIPVIFSLPQIHARPVRLR